MKKFILLSLLITTTYVYSQEIGFYSGGGLAGQKYKSIDGENKINLGGHLGLSYTHYFTDSLGIYTGLEFGSYHFKLNLNYEYQYSQNIVNDLGNAFEYRITTNQYQEDNHFTALAIPVMIKYLWGKRYKFYVQGGAKLIIPQKIKMTVNANKVHLSGYFPDKNLLIENMPNHGFGSMIDWKQKTEDNQNLSVALSLATGMYFDIGRKSRLYTGLYLDYGVTNMYKNVKSDESKPFIDYSPEGIEYAKPNGLLNNRNLLAFGIQLSYTFNFKKQEEEVPFTFHITDSPQTGIMCDIKLTNLNNNQTVTSTGVTDSHGDVTIFTRKGNNYDVSIKLEGHAEYKERISTTDKAPKKINVALKLLKIEDKEKVAEKEKVEEKKKEKVEEPVKEEVKITKEKEKEKEEEKPQIKKEKVVKEPEVIAKKELKITPEERTFIDTTKIYVTPYIGSIQISAQSKKKLNIVAEILNKYKYLRVNVIGHTCDIGKKSVNYEIGRKRAKKVVEFLIKKGNDRKQFKILSEGEDKPLVPNTSESNRVKNRRVEIKVMD